MIARAALLALLATSALVVAWFNPPPTPLPPTDTRWVKIDAAGSTLATWGGPWECVLDTGTGLLWEVKSYAEDLHDKQCSFSWYDGATGQPKRGDCFTRIRAQRIRSIPLCLPESTILRFTAPRHDI